MMSTGRSDGLVACPECLTAEKVPESIDMGVVDTLSVECMSCGFETVTQDNPIDDEQFSGVPVGYHSVARTETGVPVCINCGQTSEIALELFESDRIDEVSHPALFLQVCSRMKDEPCATQVYSGPGRKLVSIDL